MSEINKPFVLFADDDEDTLAALAVYASSLGWRYDCVNTARAIIDKVNENCGKNDCYDAIVADVNYYDKHPEGGPRITGITAAIEVRKTHPSLPIIFVTGFKTYFIQKEIESIQGDFFVKPVDLEQLFSRVGTLVHWHRLVSGNIYKGPERRRVSVNLTKFCRRATDHRKLRVPDVLTENIKEAREKYQGGNNT